MCKLTFILYIYLFLGLLKASTEIDIFIVNLKSRPDKRKLCDFQLKTLGVRSYKYIDAFNGKKFMTNTSAILAKETGLSDIKIDRNLVKHDNGPHLGCIVSHMKAFKDIISRNLTRPALILEDDFLADGMAFKDLPRFISMLPADWDVFYPGHCESQGTCGTYLASEKRICKARGCVACTQSFMVNGAKAALKMYNAANKPRLQLADMYAHSAEMNRYVLFPSIFTQQKRYLSVNSDISSGGGVWTPLTNTTIAELLKEHVGK